MPVQKSKTPSDSYLPEQKSLSMLEDDQKRVRAALGMDITEDDDPSNDTYEQMVERFYVKRARYVRVFTFVLIEINLAF